jgi:hypothetical protein
VPCYRNGGAEGGRLGGCAQGQRTDLTGVELTADDAGQGLDQGEIDLARGHCAGEQHPTAQGAGERAAEDGRCVTVRFPQGDGVADRTWNAGRAQAAAASSPLLTPHQARSASASAGPEQEAMSRL